MATPSAPIITLAPRSSNGTLEYKWAAPTSGTPNLYELELSGGGGTFTTSGTYYAVTGLTNGTLYTATVRASSDSGSTYGPTASFRPFAPGNGVPGAPATATAVSLDSYTSAMVSWTAPASSPDSPIYWYVITSPEDSSIKRTANGLTQTSLKITGLNPLSNYTFNVKAVNCPGYGPATTTTAVGPPNKGSAVFDNVSYYTFSPGIILGTNDFSIDGWYKFNTLEGGFTSQSIVDSLTVDNGFYAQIQYNPGVFQQLAFGNSTGNTAFSIPAISTDVWYYFAFARQSGTARAWIGTTPGGSASTAGGGTQSDSRDYDVATAQMVKNRFGGIYPFQLTNIRINNGSSLFSVGDATITVPSTTLTASANTRLLYLANTSGTLNDDASGYQTLTAFGTPTWSAQTPYA